MTYSITACCLDSKTFGVAIASSSMAVASRCSFVKANYGAIATQNITDPRLAMIAFDLIGKGLSAPKALDEILEKQEFMAYRQVALIDKNGEKAAFSGAKTLPIYSVSYGQSSIAAGNLLSSKEITEHMISAFEESRTDDFASRLLNALKAAELNGGEIGGEVHSGGIVVASEHSWPIIDLRIDWAENNFIEEISELWRRWKPQVDDYIMRAVNPDKAPSFSERNKR